ncbi:MAG: tetratricopeptide repeat protein [Rickettsiales bacterium]|nr:tetratricopeptide repeat protein [Rickettsiales bacterium]
MSSTALASPEYGETLPYRADGHGFQPSNHDDDPESPYQKRKEFLQSDAQGLPSVQLLKKPSTPDNIESDRADAAVADVVADSASAASMSTAEPMKINIPNLRAMEDHETTHTQAEAEIKSFKPAIVEDDRPQQTVAEFKPLPWHSDIASQPAAEELAALAPSAGTDTPLIPLPEAAPLAEPPPALPAPVVAATTATAAASAPPALPELPPVSQPEAVEAKAPDNVSDKQATEALDQALRDKVALNAKTDRPQDLPMLQSDEVQKKVTKTPAAKPETEQASPEKSYSPLDTEPEMALSDKSEAIARRIPSNLDRPTRPQPEEVTIDRARNLDDVFEDDVKVDKGGDVQAVQHEAMGIKIEVKNRNRNLDYELEKAYDALVTGQPSLAIEIYKNILTNDPNNKGALFGLATTYHRSGQLDQARNYYGKLLAIAPKHRDGLNNFLVLLADEAPEQALAKMEELAKRNPDFSPIPAQMAVIHQRLGNNEQATEHMFRAVALAPENMVYRYNLAIMLDKQKKYDEAARLYKQLIEAAGRGMTIPGNLQKIQQRLTFISSNRQ